MWHSQCCATVTSVWSQNSFITCITDPIPMRTIPQALSTWSLTITNLLSFFFFFLLFMGLSILDISHDLKLYNMWLSLVWLLLLSIIFLRFIYFAACINTYSCVWSNNILQCSTLCLPFYTLLSWKGTLYIGDTKQICEFHKCVLPDVFSFSLFKFWSLAYLCVCSFNFFFQCISLIFHSFNYAY